MEVTGARLYSRHLTSELPPQLELYFHNVSYVHLSCSSCTVSPPAVGVPGTGSCPWIVTSFLLSLVLATFAALLDEAFLFGCASFYPSPESLFLLNPSDDL